MTTENRKPYGMTVRDWECKQGDKEQRAEAYPKLVEALRIERAHADKTHLREMTKETAARAARLDALLRELGEAE